MEEYMTKRGRAADLILLQNHGVFVGADTIDGIKEKYAGIMEKLESKIQRKPDLDGALSSWGDSEKIGGFLAELAAAAGEGPWTAVFRRNNEIAALVRDRAAFRPVSSSFTPDHIVYSGGDPLFVETGDEGASAAGPGGTNLDRLRGAWKKYLEKTGRIPKIAALRGMGVFGIGPSEKTARLALELFTDTVKVAVYAQSFGGERFMSQDKIDFILNWEVERYRSKVSTK
jgi:rhamnose utilization protein RhaD (predicted bifunctional aldolase and dehydrogenase)